MSRSEQWRQRAIELRELAEKAPEIQRALQDCAKAYEVMAEREEKREATLHQNEPLRAKMRG